MYAKIAITPSPANFRILHISLGKDIIILECIKSKKDIKWRTYKL
jgi:hypothetical protein